MPSIQDFIRIDPTARMGETAEESTLLLQPLSLWWEDEREFIEWETENQDARLQVKLPFGCCELAMALDDLEKNALHAVVSVTIEREVHLHSLECRFQSAFNKPEKVWIPHLRPGAEQVMADQVFRSPAVMLVQDGKGMALVPDLAVWPETIRTTLDFQRYGPGGLPVLSYGLGHFEPTGHIFFKRVKARKSLRAGTTRQAAFYLIRIPDAVSEPLAFLASFLWKRFAPVDEIKPQVLPFKHYEQLACRRIFAPDLYHAFDYRGKAVGGMITQTITSGRKPRVLNRRGVRQYIRRQGLFVDVLRWIQSKMFTNPAGYRVLTRALHSGWLQIAPMVSFQSWFNQARTALGAALHAKRTGDDGLLAGAERIIELALSAPQEEGCFPAVCFFPEGDVFWMRGTRAFELIDSFHLPDAAVTGFHLLQWHQLVREDERILDRCNRLARFFLSLQDPAGAFPTWAKPGPNGPIVDESLKRSASAAAPAMLLARLYSVIPDERYGEAARAALAFIEREVMPKEKWFDYELFYSCAGRPTGEEGPDPYTDCYPANTLSMYWAAQAALDLYRATRKETMLALARSIFARLSLYQQVFDHPRISIHTFGGFGVMNADAEWNDARQGLFVPLMLEMYRATGEVELLERGIAALRACFTTMLIEEHRHVAPGNLVNFRLSDRGSILENYAHTGRDEVTAGYLSPDWGCGTALYASGLAFSKFGQVFVDLKNKKAWGIDLCRARLTHLKPGEVAIEVEPRNQTDLEVVLNGAGGRIERVLVNGRPAEAIGAGKDRFRISMERRTQ